MKKLAVALVLFLNAAAVTAQPSGAPVSEGDISRILRTLSSDRMMGRPASEPALIEPATVFIEGEFRRVGLKPLAGLDGFRQEFEKRKISPGTEQVLVAGRKVDGQDYVIISDRAEFRISQGLAERSIRYDSGITNPEQFFLGKARQELMDTVSSIIRVSPQFSQGFARLKKYFQERFANNRSYVKVFVLGNGEAGGYTVEASQKIEDITMSNVVGVLEGRGKKDEMVIFSAHYDHIGIQPPVNGDSIANGADDDASGTTAVIALADHFRKAGINERTLIFVAFTAEEIGGYGSHYFSEQLEADKVVAMFNIEMIGKPSKWGRGHAFITGFERSDFGRILQMNAQASGFQFQPDPYPDQNLFYRSDNATLARLGVPAHSISTDQIDVDPFYHTVDDEFETTDMDNMAATVRGIAAGAMSIVKGTDTPSRIDKESVRD